LAALLVLSSPPSLRAAEDAAGPLVYAAASLTEVLQQVGADYARERGGKVRFSFGSTATLARQIEAGARADVFVAADQDWMDYLDRRGLVQRAGRVDLLGNRLVLVAPADSRLVLAIGRGMPIRAALGAAGRLSLADPASVPAGRYAKAALTSLGVWEQVEGRLVAAENVRMALLFVARGEAPLGVVYATDARAEPRVRVVGAFPANSHPPIVYPAALTTGARAAATPFLQYLSGAAAQRRFAAAGFSIGPVVPETPRAGQSGRPDDDHQRLRSSRSFTNTVFGSGAGGSSGNFSRSPAITPALPRRKNVLTRISSASVVTGASAASSVAVSAAIAAASRLPGSRSSVKARLRPR
jgi:molybdate transport system substrate-binding protein